LTEPGGRDGSTLSSVQNAARLLKELGSAEGELGVSELSRRLALGKSTVHRLLATLTAERILEHNPATGTYRLGLVMYELGARVSMHRILHDAATTVVEELRNATKETVQIAVLDGREVVYVERLESPHTLRLFGRIGHRMPAHSTSTGKVLLAFLPRERLEVLPGNGRWSARPRRPSPSTRSSWPSWRSSGPAGGPRTTARARSASPASPRPSATPAARSSPR
jgi:DNA-binding IclR family transcriptional regulator